MTSSGPLYISEENVKRLLTWPAVFEATKQALRSVCEQKGSDDQPTAYQPARMATHFQGNSVGMLFSMIGQVNQYKLPIKDAESKTFDTIACKLVTSFVNNSKLPNPLPNIMATICLFDTLSGQLKAIVDGTEITAWRTAAASLVATKYLYFDRVHGNSVQLGIVGCGVQGRIHAIGMCTIFPIDIVNLWNRTHSKATALAAELETMKSSFKNPNLKIIVWDSVEESVKSADVIVIATFATSPILNYAMLKDGVHINAIGAGATHHSELANDIYSQSRIYVDNHTSARVELKDLGHPIVAEVGEVINNLKPTPQHPLTIYHSMGMAAEDATVGQLIYELFKAEQ